MIVVICVDRISVRINNAARRQNKRSRQSAFGMPTQRKSSASPDGGRGRVHILRESSVSPVGGHREVGTGAGLGLEEAGELQGERLSGRCWIQLPPAGGGRIWASWPELQALLLDNRSGRGLLQRRQTRNHKVILCSFVVFTSLDLCFSSSHLYILTHCILSQSFRLVKLKDPIGKSAWNGEWNNKSELWDQVIGDNTYRDGNETSGAFWMCLDDFMKYISRYTFIWMFS